MHPRACRELSAVLAALGVALDTCETGWGHKFRPEGRCACSRPSGTACSSIASLLVAVHTLVMRSRQAGGGMCVASWLSRVFPKTSSEPNAGSELGPAA